MDLTVVSIVILVFGFVVAIVLASTYRKPPNMGSQMNYPDAVQIVNSGDPDDDPLLKVKRIYAELYGVDITTVTDDTSLGSRFAEIIMNVTFQLGIVASGNANTTIKELADGSTPP